MVGVSAATGAMGSLLGKLAVLLSNEYKLLKGVRKQIQFLERELSTMRVLLEKMADMEEKLDGMAKDWKGKVRDLSYEIEDCIDRFMERLGSGDAKPKFMKRTARRLRTLWARHGIATQIKELKARVVEESERRDRYKLNESYYAPTRTVEIDPRITAIHEEVRGLVAMDGPMKHIISLLMEEKETELKVLPIVGSGGLGKTTLAMEVYRKTGGDFQCRAFASVSRTLDLEKLLKDILSQIDRVVYKECQSESWGIEQLIPRIKKILTGKRYFIVIDDLWKEKDWIVVKRAFPDSNNGSRIIPTTRITGVANMCCSNSGAQPYQMEPLDDADSRRLFFKRIFRSDDPCPAELEEVSTRILKKCSGLPLAIVTFASFLANRTHDKDEWERLHDSVDIGCSLENDGSLKGLKDILLLSYWDLPRHLKTCLLYLCIYPEDWKIKCEDLKWKWIAEGFLTPQWGRVDQVAQNCYNELVNRNMIQQIVVEYWNGSVEYCQVHDMVLDLIISLSNEENFATILNGCICNSFPSKIHRLSMHYNSEVKDVVVHAIIENNKLHVRSLSMYSSPVKQVPHLVDFHALRVLDLQICEWLENKHLKSIGSSRQLRYLRIGSDKITELPEEFGKLQHLETLDLSDCYGRLRLPSTVVWLQKLVRLFVHGRTRLPAVDFGSMQDLEALKGLEVWKTDNPLRFAEELGHLTKLRELEIKLGINETHMADNATRKSLLELLGSSISELGKCSLRHLQIAEGGMCELLFKDPCCTYPYLQYLIIRCFAEIVPKGMASLKNLVKLWIDVCKFDIEGLHLLMGMPSLTHLKIHILTRNKEKLTVGSNGFKLLKVFGYRYWPRAQLEPAEGLLVTFAPGSVPALRRLHLHFSPMVAKFDFLAELGGEHLSGLAHLHLIIDCDRAAPGRLEALESSIKKAIELYPNCEFHVSKVSEDAMFKDDKEWEEAVAKKRKEREEAWTAE